MENFIVLLICSSQYKPTQSCQNTVNMEDLEIETGYLSQVDGSTHYKTSSTTVLCSITGPIEPKSRQELPTKLAFELIVRPAMGVPTTRKVAIQDKLNSVLKQIVVGYLYPRQLCQITFQILEAGENVELFDVKEIISCVNAATLAFIDAAIALQSMAVGVVIAVTYGDELIIDPSNEIMQNSKSVHGLVLELVDGSQVVKNVLLLDSNGDFDESTLFKVLQVGEENILKLSKQFRKLVETKIQKSLNN